MHEPSEGDGRPGIPALRPPQAVSRDSEVHGGDMVFTGTRVPVDTLIDYLEGGDSVEQFLEDFPTVERWQVEAFLRTAVPRIAFSH